MSADRPSAMRMIAALGSFCLAAGLLLGITAYITRGPIEQARIDNVNAAIAAVAPRFTNNPSADAVEVTRPDGHVITVYPAINADTLAGAAVESYSPDGFSGEIKVMYGFDSRGAVTGYRVLSHAETPGLGAKMTDWFASPEGSRTSVIGLDPTLRRAYVSKDGGDVDGITAATISSRAFLDALRRAHEAFIEYRDIKYPEK